MQISYSSKHLFVLSFFFIYSIGLFSQAYTVDVRQFDYDDGLLQVNVKCLIEDHKGRIWIGTPKGLAQFDGYNFKWFTKNNTNGKIGDVQYIGLDNDGWLWVTNQDLAVFSFLNPETGEVLSSEQRFGHELPIKLNWGEHNLGSSWQACTPIPRDKNGNLLFGIDGDPAKIIIYKKAGEFEEILVPELNKIGIFAIDENEHFWGRDLDNNYIINRKGEVLTKTKIDNEKSLNFIQSLDWNEEKMFYVGSLFEKQSKNHRKPAFSRANSNGELEVVFEPPNGYEPNFYINSQYWCLGEKGWGVFNKNGELLIEINRDDHAKSLFEATHQAYFDRTGRVWIHGQFGLSLIDVKPNRFINYFVESDDYSLPFNNSGRGIYVDENYIYANFEFGGFLKIEKDEPNSWQIIDSHDVFWDPNGKNNGYFGRPLLNDLQNRKWIGHVRYLSCWSEDLSTEIKYHFESHPKKSENQDIFSLYEDKNSTIWIGTLYNLAYKDSSSNEIKFIESLDPQTGKKLLIQAVTNIIAESDETIWLCTKNGLFLFDIAKKEFIRIYKEGQSDKHLSLPSSNINHLYIDEDKNKWLASDDGLIFWDSRSDEKTLITQFDGLPSDELVATYEDDNKNLWLASRYGIVHFDKEELKVIKSYLPKDGTAYPRVNRISHFQDDKGNIYFGGYNGITTIIPERFKNSSTSVSAEIVISKFEQFDGEKNVLVDRSNLLRQDKIITLKPEDRFFKLQFALLNFEDKSRNQYAWKVDGESEDWQYQNENILQFSRLPYGKHILKIKGRAANQVWTENELHIQVHVLVPIYLRTWFLVLSALILTGIVAFFFYRRGKIFKKRQLLLQNEISMAVRKIEDDKEIIYQQAEELKSLDKIKSRFFANVSHELRTPLSIIMGPIDTILKSGDLNSKNFTLLKMAQQSGYDLLKLIASILDLSKMESGKMELNEESILLFPLVRRIASTFDSLAQSKQISFKFNYQAEEGLVLDLDKIKIESILNNLLSNAMKFTPQNGMIQLKVEDHENRIKFSIIDNGRGIQKDDQAHLFDRFYQSKHADAPAEGGTGIGLALSHEYVKLMDGEIYLESKIGEGSSFFFEIPRKESLGTGILKDLETSQTTSNIESIVNTKEENIQVSNNLKRHSLLVVEDNSSLRTYLQTILESSYIIYTANNGQEAIDFLDKNDNLPTLIISDIMMPVLDGFQFFEFLKESEKYNFIPCIALSAKTDIQDKLKALRIGVDDYLIKPFEEEELFVRIENLINNFNARDNVTEIAAHSKEVKFSKEDLDWLSELESILTKEVSNPKYSISRLAFDLNISERQLRRRLKLLIGLSPSQYFKEIRLQTARKYFENNHFKTISQTASAVGFENAGSFSRSFLKRFGKAPSDYLKMLTQDL